MCYVGCRGPPAPEDESIAAHLMRVHDKAGNPLPHARQWSELSIFFYAGVSLHSACHQPHARSWGPLIQLEDIDTTAD